MSECWWQIQTKTLCSQNTLRTQTCQILTPQCSVCKRAPVWPQQSFSSLRCIDIVRQKDCIEEGAKLKGLWWNVPWYTGFPQSLWLMWGTFCHRDSVRLRGKSPSWTWMNRWAGFTVVGVLCQTLGSQDETWYSRPIAQVNVSDKVSLVIVYCLLKVTWRFLQTANWTWLFFPIVNWFDWTLLIPHWGNSLNDVIILIGLLGNKLYKMTCKQRKL